MECHALSNKGYAFGTLTTREDAQLDPIWLPRPSEKAREASTRSKPRLPATTVAFMPVSFVPTEWGGPDSADGGEFVISSSFTRDLDAFFTAMQSAADAAEGLR